MKKRNPMAVDGGFALISVMFLVVVVGALLGGVASEARLLADGIRADRSRVRIRAALDGGIALARHRLARAPEWTGGSVRIGGCEVVVRAARVRSPSSVCEVTVRARCGAPGAAAADSRVRVGEDRVLLDLGRGGLPAFR